MRRVATSTASSDAQAVSAAYALINDSDDPCGTVCVVWDLDDDVFVCEVHWRV